MKKTTESERLAEGAEDRDKNGGRKENYKEIILSHYFDKS